ncbi:MAG: hypothetical protein Q7R47_05220 [Candidatus Diapherotrites archaeon]|nr:hypothetical protein [Candidatus Diapherotrites archaeon]
MVIDAFGLILMFVLVLLGAISENWWFAFGTALVAIAIYPAPDTFWAAGSFLVIAWVWGKTYSELTTNGFLLMVVLIGSAVIALAFDAVFLGIVFALALIFLLLLVPGIKLTKKTSRKLREEFDDVHAGLKKAKGQNPDFFAQAESLSKETGSVVGEAITTNPNQKLVSTDTGTRASQGAKNLLDGFWKLFK